MPQQPDNHAAQTEPRQPSDNSLPIPPVHPEYPPTGTKQTRPDLAQLWQPKPARPRLSGHTAQQPRQRRSSSRQSPGIPSHTTQTLTQPSPSHLTRSPAPLSAAALLADPCFVPQAWLAWVPTQVHQPTCQPARHLTHAAVMYPRTCVPMDPGIAR